MTFERWLQTRLVEHGAKIAIDGDIGRATNAAMKKFQAERGLPVTGIADPATVEQLRTLRRPAQGMVEAAPAATMPPWMYELVRRLGLHEIDDKADLTEFLKIGKFLGDPAKNPWCGDAVESAFAKVLPDERLPTNAFFAQNWKGFGREVEPMVGAVGVIRWSPTAGHVGTVSEVTATQIGMVGGNQSNKLSNARFPRSAFIAFRWPLTFPITEYPAFHGAVASAAGIASTR